MTDDVVGLTSENANGLILEYFSVAPYGVSWDEKGRQVRVPCDVPSVAGFCSEWDVPPSRLASMLTADTVELCKAKFEHIMLVNGLGKGYDAGFAGLAMKNLAGWADKTETRATVRRELAPEDMRVLEELGIRVLESREV